MPVVLLRSDRGSNRVRIGHQPEHSADRANTKCHHATHQDLNADRIRSASSSTGKIELPERVTRQLQFNVVATLLLYREVATPPCENERDGFLTAGKWFRRSRANYRHHQPVILRARREGRSEVCHILEPPHRR